MSASQIANLDSRLKALEELAGVEAETLDQLKSRQDGEWEQATQQQFRARVGYREAVNMKAIDNGDTTPPITAVFADRIDHYQTRALVETLEAFINSEGTSDMMRGAGRDLLLLWESLCSWKFWEKDDPAFEGLQLSNYSGHDGDNGDEDHNLPFIALPNSANDNTFTVCRTAEDVNSACKMMVIAMRKSGRRR